MAERDHIAPVGAVEPVRGLLRPGQCDELRLDAGHVGLVMGREAAKVTLPRIAGWIQEHSDRREV
jgi:polyhydroxyalkanoate synthase